VLAACRLLPVVQLEIRVGDGNGCIRQIASDPGDVSRGHVLSLDLQPHRPSVARSSVERGLGLPLYFIAGSFVPIALAKSSSCR